MTGPLFSAVFLIEPFDQWSSTQKSILYRNITLLYKVSLYIYLYTGLNFCFKTTRKHIKKLVTGCRFLLFMLQWPQITRPSYRKEQKTKYDQSRRCVAMDFNPVTIQIATTTFSVILSILLCFKPAVSDYQQRTQIHLSRWSVKC